MLKERATMMMSEKVEEYIAHFRNRMSGHKCLITSTETFTRFQIVPFGPAGVGSEGFEAAIVALLPRITKVEYIQGIARQRIPGYGIYHVLTGYDAIIVFRSVENG